MCNKSHLEIIDCRFMWELQQLCSRLHVCVSHIFRLHIHMEIVAQGFFHVFGSIRCAIVVGCKSSLSVCRLKVLQSGWYYKRQ